MNEVSTTTGPDTPDEIDPERLHCTVALTGRLLDLTPYQVRKLLDAGELSSEDIGERTYIPAESVREYAARSRD